MKADNFDLYYHISSLSQIDYDKFFVEGQSDHIPQEGYTSENTTRLSPEETKDLILSLREIQEITR
jgi:UDP-N-acetylglucosamine 4,6-dehydratase/5-epimerase